ncbi:uncharacterized protein LOC141858560 [Brevipalpus obovatus]|uniref:uncharacterized protein LOC141858560 n=1 Tax=Brevipalpus obovatus TaxID=246614 RepID=UPI003D9F4A09
MATTKSQGSDKRKLKVIKSEEDGFCVTLELLEEDHTLGNALRHILMRNENVKFCGYSLPHPTERRIIMQIQTYPNKGMTGLAAFEQGLNDLSELAQIVKNKFAEAPDLMETEETS